MAGHLERLCHKQGLYDFAVRDTLFEHLGRKLECECQVLYDERGIVENEPRFVFSMVLLISFLSIGLQFRKSLLIKYFKIDAKLKMVLSCYRIPPSFSIDGSSFITTGQKPKSI
jgi:hypothetical protein